MAAVTGDKPHVLAVPLPGQGHINPLMILCRQIAKHGIKVTFVNPQSIHDKIISAAKISAKEDEDEDENKIVLETVPDGLTWAADSFELMQTLTKTMPQTLTDLIERINSTNPKQKISCVIADLSFAWAFDIAEKMGAEPVGFSPPSLACLAMAYHSSKLVEEGTLDENGNLKKGDGVSLSDDVPAWKQDELPWLSGNPESDKNFFEMTKVYKQTSKAKWRLCNSCHELEPGATALLRDHFPVGPLHLLDSDADKSLTSFYSEDASCLNWLDDKQAASVIYVSFGSTAMFSQQQLDELALGLEKSGRDFLWVTRPDLANGSRVVYPEGFLERLGERGKIVDWAPQEKVLSHRSIGCFMSHCGWNSTIEGISRGVPFLCWPYFADQLHNMRYICDQWESGLRICLDGGIRSRHEIKKKIDMVFGDSKIKENALKLKEMCGRSVSEGGSSYNNLMKFIDHLRK